MSKTLRGAVWNIVLYSVHLLVSEAPSAGAESQMGVPTFPQVIVQEKLPALNPPHSSPIEMSPKESGQGVWVIAEAAVQLTDDMTVQEGRSRSHNEARRKAIEKALGVFVKGKTVVYNHVLAEDLVQSVVHGFIADEIILEEGIREIGQASTGRATLYATKLKALVRPVQAERRADLSLKAVLNQTVFRDGEEIEIRVSSGNDVHLHIFSVGQDESVTILFPNRFAQDTFNRADQPFVFPNDSQRAVGIRLRVFAPAGSNRATERIKIIATRRKCDLVKAKFRESIFQVYEGKDTGLVADLLRELALLDDSDWAEVTLPYEVYSNRR